MSYGNMGYTNRYKEAGVHGESQTNIEAGALIRTASKLNEIKNDFENKKDELEGALIKNRRLWSIFAGNLGEPDCQLTDSLKNGIANLAMFVFKQTLKLMAKPDPNGLGVLIEINMNVAHGLTSERRKNQSQVPSSAATTENTATSSNTDYSSASGYAGNNNLGSF